MPTTAQDHILPHLNQIRVKHQSPVVLWTACHVLLPRPKVGQLSFRLFPFILKASTDLDTGGESTDRVPASGEYPAAI